MLWEVKRAALLQVSSEMLIYVFVTYSLMPPCNRPELADFSQSNLRVQKSQSTFWKMLDGPAVFFFNVKINKY